MNPHPICWKELLKKNITCDIEESVLSTENTIEPYLSEYRNKE